MTSADFGVLFVDIRHSNSGPRVDDLKGGGGPLGEEMLRGGELGGDTHCGEIE